MKDGALVVLRAEILEDPEGVGYSGLSYGEMAAKLNERPLVDNPEGYTMVADLPGNLVEILTLMPRAERVAILEKDSFKELAIRVWKNDLSQVHTQLDAVVAWVAAAPGVAFESVSVQMLADQMLGYGEVEVLGALLVLLAEDPGLSAETVAGLETRLGKKKRDPSWSATVAGESRATVLGLPVVLAKDVQVAVHLAEAG